MSASARAFAAAAFLCAWLLPPPAVRSAEGAGAPPAMPPATIPAGAPAADSIEQLWSRGEAAFRAGDLQGALSQFEAALARDGSRARSWNYLGGVHFQRGDLPQALRHFQRAVELDPRDVRACNNLGTALERLGQYGRAEEAYRRAALIDPEYPLTQRNLGLLLSRRLGNPEAARRAWLRYLELAPDGAHAAEVRRELDALPP